MTTLARGLGLMLVLCLPATGWAACTGTAPDYSLSYGAFSPGTLNPNVSDGTVMYTSSFLTVAPSNNPVTCTGGLGTLRFDGMTTPDTQYTAYPTNIPGIGLRFDVTVPSVGTLPTAKSVTLTNIPSMSFTIKLVKIGPIASGGVISGRIMKVMAQYGTTSQSDFFYVTLNGNVALNWTRPTCAATTSDIRVPMNDVPIATLRAGGTSQPKSFSIDLTCSGGTTSTPVYIAMSDQSNPANTSSILSLTSGSTAKGVGIQVLRNNGSAIVSYGPESSTTQRWMEKATATNGNFSIPMTAHYVATGTQTLSAGSAVGIATFTISYY